MAMLKACAHPGCLDYAIDGSAHCFQHRRLANRERNRRKNWQRITAPGDGAARRLRRTILANFERGNLTPCVHCWSLHPPTGIQVDHIIPLIDNGHDVDDNVQPLCNHCHTTKTTTENQQRHQNTTTTR